MLEAVATTSFLPLTFFDDSKHFVLAHDEVLSAIQADLLTGVLAKEHLVADLDVDQDERAVFLHLAFTDGQDLALLGLFLCRVRNDDATDLLFRVLDAFNEGVPNLVEN